MFKGGGVEGGEGSPGLGYCNGLDAFKSLHSLVISSCPADGDVTTCRRGLGGCVDRHHLPSQKKISKLVWFLFFVFSSSLKNGERTF